MVVVGTHSPLTSDMQSANRAIKEPEIMILLPIKREDELVCGWR